MARRPAGGITARECRVLIKAAEILERGAKECHTYCQTAPSLRGVAEVATRARLCGYTKYNCLTHRWIKEGKGWGI